VNVVLAVLPELAMAAFFAVTWVSPTALDPHGPRVCAALFFIEFLSMHSTPFLVGSDKNGTGLFVVLLYSPFIIFVAILVKSLWPLCVFSWHVLTNVWSFPSGPDQRPRAANQHWVVTLLLFLGAMTLTCSFPWPALGWNEQSAPGLAWSASQKYHVFPVWGVTYFTMSAVAAAVRELRRGSRRATPAPELS